jgi:hypothetical protein
MRFVPAATVRPHRPTRRSLGSVQLEDGSSRGLEQYLRVFRRQSTPYGCGPGFRPFRLLLAPDMAVYEVDTPGVLAGPSAVPTTCRRVPAGLGDAILRRWLSPTG